MLRFLELKKGYKVIDQKDKGTYVKKRYGDISMELVLAV
jgi:hypothetical protein